MTGRFSKRAFYACVVGLSTLSGVSLAAANELLVADRLENRVLRYSDDGSFLAVLVDDAVHLDEPNGMTLSPDGTQLYVASRANSSVIRYDYDGLTATNATVLVNSGIDTPASLLFSDDGDTLYVSNLGSTFQGDTVSRFHPDGASAGADLTGGLPTGRSGLAFDPAGNLLVNAFVSGEVLRYNEASSMFEPFIGPDPALQGAGNLLVNGNDLYVAAGFSGTVTKYNATTGEADPAFTPITGLEFPASLALAPDGNGFLVGILGFAGGTGRIDRYGFDGTFIGQFADHASPVDDGFSEPTGLLTVPSPILGQPGDTNGDRAVDLEDLNNVRNHFGDTGSADGSLEGDAFPFDGSVDLGDLNGVRNNFGAGEAGGPAVPEPSSALLALIALSGWGLARRRLPRN